MKRVRKCPVCLKHPVTLYRKEPKSRSAKAIDLLKCGCPFGLFVWCNEHMQYEKVIAFAEHYEANKWLKELAKNYPKK